MWPVSRKVRFHFIFVFCPFHHFYRG
jgi:hypothetical protein